MIRSADSSWKARWRALGESGARLLVQLEGLSNPPPPPPVDVSRLAGPIPYGTIELACLHEAGHAAAAFAARARVLRMDITADSTAPGGRTRVKHRAEQRRTIALGGFAIELHLWRAGRLRWFDGSRPTEAEMRRGVARSAQDDRVIYFGGDMRTPDGRWPAAMDDAFFLAADDLRRSLDVGFVQRAAAALLVKLSLREGEIAMLAATPLFATDGRRRASPQAAASPTRSPHAFGPLSTPVGPSAGADSRSIAD